MEAYHSLGMVEFDASGKSALGYGAQSRDGELIKLIVTSALLAVESRAGSREAYPALARGTRAAALSEKKRKKEEKREARDKRGQRRQRTSLGTRCMAEDELFFLPSFPS